MIHNENKQRDLEKLREITLDVRSDSGIIKDYLEFMCKQLIDIKYDLREIRNKNLCTY